MDFRFTEEQNMLKETVRRFVEAEIPRELAVEIDEQDRFPHELLQKLSDLGFMGINVTPSPVLGRRQYYPLRE